MAFKGAGACRGQDEKLSQAKGERGRERKTYKEFMEESRGTEID